MGKERKRYSVLSLGASKEQATFVEFKAINWSWPLRAVVTNLSNLTDYQWSVNHWLATAVLEAIMKYLL